MLPERPALGLRPLRHTLVMCTRCAIAQIVSLDTACAPSRKEAEAAFVQTQRERERARERERERERMMMMKDENGPARTFRVALGGPTKTCGRPDRLASSPHRFHDPPSRGHDKTTWDGTSMPFPSAKRWPHVAARVARMPNLHR